MMHSSASACFHFSILFSSGSLLRFSWVNAMASKRRVHVSFTWLPWLVTILYNLLRFVTIRYDSLQFVTICYISVYLVTLRLATIRYDSRRFVTFCYTSLHCVTKSYEINTRLFLTMVRGCAP